MLDGKVVTVRHARVEDAPFLCAAEREISRVSGLLVSQPDELLPEAFESLIATLINGSGCYLVAEDTSMTSQWHGFLRELPSNNERTRDRRRAAQRER